MDEDLLPPSDNEAIPQVAASGFIAGFWKRPLAFFIDVLLLGILGFLVGQSLFDTFVMLGGWGRFIGSAIALLYFGILNSAKGNGQTIGKRLMNIKVVYHNGQPISLPRSFLRSTILGIPFFLNGSPISLPSQIFPLTGLISLLTLGINGAVIYLYIFNRKTRQSFHDLVVGTYVTKSSISSKITVIGVRKIHLIVVSLWLLVTLIFPPILYSQIQKAEPFQSLLAVCGSIQKSGKVNRCNVTVETNYASGRETKNLIVSVVWKTKLTPNEAEIAINEIASIVLQENPNTMRNDSLKVIVSYGFDLGIASSWKYYSKSYSPAAGWLKELKKQNGKI